LQNRKKKRKFGLIENVSSSRQIKEITKKAREDIIKEKCGFCNKGFLKTILFPQKDSPNGFGCKECIETE